MLELGRARRSGNLNAPCFTSEEGSPMKDQYYISARAFKYFCGICLNKIRDAG